jgi:hypothetical protein
MGGNYEQLLRAVFHGQKINSKIFKNILVSALKNYIASKRIQGSGPL